MPFCAIMRSWTLLAAFGGSYAPVETHISILCQHNTCYYSIMQEAHMPYMAWEQVLTLHHRAQCGIR